MPPSQPPPAAGRDRPGGADGPGGPDRPPGPDGPDGLLVVVDVGSTYTKAAIVDPVAARIVARGQTPTTAATDVLHGVDALAAALGAPDGAPLLVCSSAGGGLRLAVVGFERTVTAEAGRRVGLSAGARVVHVASGRLDTAALARLRADGPDVVLLVGGTDGGNADTLVHNAGRLARSPLRKAVPVVIAGNVDAAPAAAAAVRAAGRPVVEADNVLPRIGVLAPASARAAIRAAFLRHVIGGKGLSRGPRFARLVRAATPDAVLRAVEVLADVSGRDLLVVDVGGATTDVYSRVDPSSGDHAASRHVVAPLACARTVEADLGVRWSADGVLDAAAREGLAVAPALRRYAARVAAEPGHVPSDPVQTGLDLELARLAAVVAVRRHARPGVPGDPGRDLGDVALVLGSGGVLRHADAGDARGVLAAVGGDVAGGWRTPRSPRLAVDAAYLLGAIGMLADLAPDAARRLAARLLH